MGQNECYTQWDQVGRLYKFGYLKVGVGLSIRLEERERKNKKLGARQGVEQGGVEKEGSEGGGTGEMEEKNRNENSEDEKEEEGRWREKKGQYRG